MNNLYRSRENKIIAGVAGGMAEYAHLDVALVRLIWVLAFFAGGAGFLAYIICWIVIPESRTESGDSPVNYAQQTDSEQDVLEQRSIRRRNAGLVLIVLGLVFLIKNIVPEYYWDKAWPLLLVLLGLYILLGRKGDRA